MWNEVVKIARSSSLKTRVKAELWKEAIEKGDARNRQEANQLARMRLEKAYADAVSGKGFYNVVQEWKKDGCP